MNREKLLSAFTGSLLAFVIALGSIGCLQSAFDLPVSDATMLRGTVAGIALLGALILQWKHGGLTLCCLLALAAGYLYREGTAVQQFLQLLQHISIVYDRAYHWGILQFTETSEVGTSDLVLGIWAVVVSLATVRSVCLQKQVWLPVLTALVPFAACIVVTDTVPGEKYLFALLAGLILLLLTDTVRRENRMQGIRLTLSAALPVTLGLMVLFHTIPQETYINRSVVLQENLRTALDHMPQLMEKGLTEATATFRGIPNREVNLAGLSSRIPFTYPVMEVTAEKNGTLYLRGQDYDRYDGLSWTASENREESFFRSDFDRQTITIRTRGKPQLRYLPYYPADETLLSGGLAENPERLTEYTILQASLPEDWRQTAYLSREAEPPAIFQPYLTLPEATRQSATAFLSHMYQSNASHTEKADIIAALVTDCADYSLSPQKMPEGEADFALWFLQEADTGYCIHFATAAAVLLRAADIPARYVTGYMAEVTAGETVTITEEEAHAWAEYYEPNLGCWIPLEVTPAEAAAAPAPVAPTAQTMPTQASTLPAATEIPESADSAEHSTIPAAPVQAPELPPSGEAENLNLLLLLLIPVLVLAAVVQRSVRLELRCRRRHRGTANVQALQRWREAERLARLLKETPAEELIDLAQKAKYSQHEITAEELQYFDSYCRSCLRRLKEKPIYLRFVYRYFYAVY